MAFSSFNRDNNATAFVTGDGRANFDLHGFGGWLSDWINDDRVHVAVRHVGDVQVAVTEGDHQLQGIRIWWAEPSGDHQVTAATAAFERPRGLGNWIGFKTHGADQRKI